MSYYTSYETSLALREAGAPQAGDVPLSLWTTYGGIARPMLTRAAYVPEMGVGEARAFRLDEILEALARDEKRPDITLSMGASGACNVEAQDDRMPITSGVQGYGDTPVEAAADCWLTALKIAAREARP